MPKMRIYRANNSRQITRSTGLDPMPSDVHLGPLDMHAHPILYRRLKGLQAQMHSLQAYHCSKEILKLVSEILAV